MTLNSVSTSDFDKAVKTFQEGWLAADNSGLAGHRTEWGIQALIFAGWRPTSEDAQKK